MFVKISTVAIAALQVASFVEAAKSSKSSSTSTSSSSKLDKPQDYWKSWKSQVDPLNITIPTVPQTTSQNPTDECAYYTATNFEYNEKEWPNVWETATSNGMTKTAEFKALYSSIDWTKAPNVKPRKLKSDGSIDMSGYDESKDPDCWWSASTCTKPKLKDINEDIYTCEEPETWGLTYDDGPNCSHNAFYDYLEEKNLKASMFYIGSNVIDWPYGAQRGAKAGHHISDHTWSHQLMTTLTNEEVLAELYYTQKAIKMVTGVTPRYWRPAMGDVDDRVRWVATQLNLTAIIWDLDTDDWAAGSSKTVEEVEETYEDYIEMGSNGTFANSGQIVLTHEIDNTTMSLALKFLPKIQSSYKHVVDVATCMNITQPYHETEVVHTTFADYLNASSSSAAPAADSAADSANTTTNSSASTTTEAAAGTTDVDLSAITLAPAASASAVAPAAARIQVATSGASAVVPALGLVAAGFAAALF